VELLDRRQGQLVIGHAASDIEPGTATAMARSYNATSELTITPRDRATGPGSSMA
jgi:hypothetical protein